jgi:hypothetical protein
MQGGVSLNAAKTAAGGRHAFWREKAYGMDSEQRRSELLQFSLVLGLFLPKAPFSSIDHFSYPYSSSV